ncbi:hypothetical protein [Acinetobacter larvae]|uniref:hypothetical protein n=1 Tax=Acinetobacter larvae TaxID=1789224 RepID=UPI000AD0BDF4|nr:hypothetical protein [Acinetobacter larvae]
MRYGRGSIQKVVVGDFATELVWSMGEASRGDDVDDVDDVDLYFAASHRKLAAMMA